MALNFPASPVDGQIFYDATSGNRYVYDATATKWKYAANNDPYTGVSDTQILFNSQGAITGNTGLTFSANTLYANTVNVTGYIYGNGAFLTGVASDLSPAFNKANSAYTVANAAFDAANNAVTDFSPAFNKANGAYTVANAAFDKANAAVTISTTAPGSPTVGALWWDETNATMYVYYNDGDSSQWVSATPENDADWATVVNIYNITNTAFNVANAAFTSANNVAPQVAPAFNTANAAFEKANGAFNTTNAAFIQANVTAPIAVSAYTTANAAYNQANDDFTLAAAAFTVANSAFGAANNVAPQVTPAFNTANAAYTVANAAYNAANGKVSSTGGSITGDLSIVGTLIVSGNTYQYNSNTMVVSDPLIYLAANNYTTDLVDIGFIANYVNTGGANVHTGLYREHTNKEYYLFQGYDQEPLNNHIGALSNNMTLSVLNADVRTSNLNLGGANAIVWISSAYGVANAAFGKANTALQNTSGVFSGNLTLTGNLGIGTGSSGPFALDVVGSVRSLYSSEGFQSTGDTIGRDFVAGKSSLATCIGYVANAAMVQGTNFSLSTTPNLSLQPYGGNVGIGVTSPGSKLTVTDSLAITNSGGSQYLLMGNQDSGGNNRPGIIRSWNGGNFEFGYGTSWSGTGGTFASLVYIGSNGQVGIGTGYSPTALFHIQDTSNRDGTGHIMAENTNTGTAGLTNSQILVKNRYGASQLMQWEDRGLRIGPRWTANSGAGNIYITAGDDVTRMTIDSSGRVSMPYQPGFSVSYSGAGYIAAEGDTNSWDAVLWNTATGNGRHNTGGHYNGATGMFTAPVAGRYLFMTQIHHHAGGGATNSYCYMDIAFGTTSSQANIVAATSYHRNILYLTPDTWWEMPPQVTILNLAANDSVFVRIVNTGTATFLGASRPDHNRWSCWFLG